MTRGKKPILIDSGGVAIVSTNAMSHMAKEARKKLRSLGVDDIDFHCVDFTRFACGEVKPKITKNVRAKDVYLFYDFKTGSFNDDLMNLCLTLDALHLASVGSITLVVPFLPYLRQDRKDEPRTPISAAVMIRMLQVCPSLKHLITVDMHSDQLQAVFTISTDHLPGQVVMAEWARKRFAKKFAELVVVAPDFGSAKRVRKLADSIDTKLGVAILEKKRDATEVEVLSIIGDSVLDKICLINDDMMDTCSTIIVAAKALYEQGAKKVVLTATHPVFSPKSGSSAYEKLAAAQVEVVVTDSLATKKEKWLTVLPLAEYMAHTILQHITRDGSVSNLIKGGIHGK